jgi:peptidoglycan/LPS O-acetylase OafA/YrhL
MSFLDLARWLAALTVFIGHLRNPLFLGFGSLATVDRPGWVKAWYFVTGWFGEAVVVFFVLSGFLVGGLAVAKAIIGRFVPENYAVDRVTRLFVAFLPALVLTALLDSMGWRLFSGTGLWDHTQPMLREKVSTAPFIDMMTPMTFFTNAAMLQTFFVTPYGSNQPLWTISAEFWFYVVFGLVLAALVGRGGRRLPLAALALAVTAVLGRQFVELMGLWLIGVAVVFAPAAAAVPQVPGTKFSPWRRVIRLLQNPLTALAVLFAVLVLVRLKQDGIKGGSMILVRNYVVALTFAWLLVTMRGATFRPLERMARFNRFMADFSYSLYLIHFPLMLFLLGALHKTGRFDGIATGYRATDPQGLFVYGLVIALVLLSAWGFARLTEHQTWRVRKWLKARLRQRLKSEPA